MSLVILLAGLVMIVGMLAYALSVNGKVQELGRLAFFAGLLALLLQVGPVFLKF